MDEVEEVWTHAELDDLNIIWNHAADYGADGEAPHGTPPGIVQLSHLLRVYNSVMGGGLGFAVEVNEPFRLRRAVDALRYFGFGTRRAAGSSSSTLWSVTTPIPGTSTWRPSSAPEASP